MDFGLKGRTALVVGADLTVGKACAVALAREGARLALAGPKSEALNDAVAATEAEGAEAYGIVQDSAGAAGGEAIAHAALATLGSVDIVVAILPPLPEGYLEDIGGDRALAKAWEWIVGLSAIYQGVGPGMKERNWGRLVFVGRSEAKGITGRAADLDRVIGLGVLGLQKTLSGDWGRFGVTANTVLWDDAIRPADEIVAGAAYAATYLASAPASYMDGVVFTAEADRGTGTY